MQHLAHNMHLFLCVSLYLLCLHCGCCVPAPCPALPPPTQKQADPGEFPDGYVAICAIVKNQHRDIREWLEYHRWLGVGKVYVYDNNSTVRPEDLWLG